MCIRHLQLLNENETVNDMENVFYQKIDFENVGIVGHSQGGVGVINAVTVQQHSDIFKAAVSISPTNQEMAQALQWDYDAAMVKVPIMLISGEGGGDDWVVTGEQLEEIYNAISSDKIMLRRKNTAHGETLYSANGYVTAWFLYWLQSDENAGKAFIGEVPEIMKNALYQDQKIETLAAAAENEADTVAGTVRAVQGLADCSERCELADTIFAGGFTPSLSGKANLLWYGASANQDTFFYTLL